jgi:hypothetical protein
MNSTLLMTMPMRTDGSVAPDVRVRVSSWQHSLAPVSAGLGLGVGSFVCVTKTDHQDNATEINTKAYGVRRPQETST